MIDFQKLKTKLEEAKNPGLKPHAKDRAIEEVLAMLDLAPRFEIEDNINVVERDLPLPDGRVLHFIGPSVRSLIKNLQQADPDDVLVYVAELTPELKKADLVFGIIGGVAIENPYKVAFMFGPEASPALKEAFGAKP